MKKMYGVWSLLLTVLLCVALLAGCSSTGDTSSKDDSSSTTTTTTEAATTTTTAAATTTTTETADTTTTAGEATTTTTEAEDTTTTTVAPVLDESLGGKVAALALTLEGTTYKFGAQGPDEFDNSGLVYYCFKQNGVTVPRKTSDMYLAGTAVEKEDLKPGDVVFFSVDKEGVAQYAGVYVGDNKFVASNNENNPTQVYSIAYPYFSSRYVGARRYN